MGRSNSVHRRGVSRRGFIVGAGAGALVGLAAGVPLSWLGRRVLQDLGHDGEVSSFTGRAVEVPQAAYAMPGPFPGRVIEVNHRGSVKPDNSVCADAVKVMMDRGMCALTGAEAPIDAWRRFFQPGDIVGIKVNPVGHKPTASDSERRPAAVGVVSSPEVLLEIVRGLKSAGVRPRDIIVFDRYAEEFVTAGYDAVMREREMADIRWYGSSYLGGNRQVDIDGFHDGTRASCPPELARHVVGYDPDVFVHMGFAGPEHDPKDDRRFRSHLSVIVSRMVDKIITIPVLKDHRSAGVTLALKNLSHGMNNNVARSHLSNIVRWDGSVSGPNQCNTFIPTAASQHLIRQKATLHILDGLLGVYEGGPGNWNQTWGTWQYKGLFFATDPVALDHVGWEIIDTKRAQEGWPAVAHMGLLQDNTALKLSRRLAALAASGTLQATSLSVTGDNLEAGRGSEVFDRRQPEHIILAGEVGLGVFDARSIEHRRIVAS
jgi:uncharacterized protein (DUF362 family)